VIDNRKNLSTGIYVRVSTEEQAQEGFSVRGQTEKLKSYALLKDWDIFDIYADEGISGKNIVDRPAITRLIDDIENGKVNNVLVFKVDRLTRSTRNLLELVELFEEYNCAFNSLTESIDTDTPSGRMFLKIIGIFAEFERENLVSRLRLGFERKAKEGYTLANNNISYGYEKAKGQKVQTVNEDESKIVNEIFSMFMYENMSMTQIAKILNARKIPTKNKTNWQTNTIKHILTNPTYVGKVRYSLADDSKYFEADGHHEAIVSEKIFQLVQEKMSNIPHVSRTKKPKSDNYFCGVLVCGACGNKFTTKNVTRTRKNGNKIYARNYICSGKIYHNDDVSCKSPQINHEKMEQAFIDYIQNINDPTEIEGIDIENNPKKIEQELIESIVDCEKNLSILQNKKREIMELFVKGNIEFGDYKKMVGLMNAEYDVLDGELQRKKTKLPLVMSTPDVLPEDVILNIKENWIELNNNERMMFLQQFVKKITIKVEKVTFNSNVVRIENIKFHTRKKQEERESMGARMRRLKSVKTR